MNTDKVYMMVQKKLKTLAVWQKEKGITFIEQKEGSFTIEVMEKNSYIGFYWLVITEGEKTSVH